MKKVLCLFLAVLLMFVVCGCGGDDSGTLKADHWYHYKDLDIVNMQNCLVSNAFVRNAGDVFVNYYPVCKHCHETGSTLSIAIVDEENPFLKTYYCNCGGQTTIQIKIVI